MDDRAPQTTPDRVRQNGKPKRKRRAWTPGDRDHLIYQWVKFDGQTQAHTAADFGISQATVSRIIDRYERWQAHADPREGRRAQRWLTYERNERILASALRIADRMEGVTELHKSVRTKPQSEWYKEGTEIRSEERGVDRHGVAARFLRLAFRINMEQLKLVEQDPPAMPEPLSEEELDAEAERDNAVADDLAGAERRAAEQFAEAQVGAEQSPAAAEPAVLREQVCSRLEESSAPPAEPDEARLNLHKVHNGRPAGIAASADQPCTCAADNSMQKTASDACIADADQEGANPTCKRGKAHSSRCRTATLAGAAQ